jgi:hypothetical protein
MSLIDEMYLCRRRARLGDWQTGSASARLFNTTTRGGVEEFSLRIVWGGWVSRKLGLNRSGEVGEVHGWAWTMGFKGRYSQTEAGAELDLDNAAQHRWADTLGVEETLHLFPGAYGSPTGKDTGGQGGTLAFTVIVGSSPFSFSLQLFVFATAFSSASWLALLPYRGRPLEGCQD